MVEVKVIGEGAQAAIITLLAPKQPRLDEQCGAALNQFRCTRGIHKGAPHVQHSPSSGLATHLWGLHRD